MMSQSVATGEGLRCCRSRGSYFDAMVPAALLASMWPWGDEGADSALVLGALAAVAAAGGVGPGFDGHGCCWACGEM